MVYFHYPEFSRKPQMELKESMRMAVHTLPLVRQLLPDIPVAYDDDAYIPGLTTTAVGATKFYWLICCGSVFLGEADTGKLFASEDTTLFPLLDKLLRATGRPWGSDDAHAAAPSFSTAYGHVCVLGDDEASADT